MEAHFLALGIPRGCDESTMKKAYHQKALALHPDRNPAGAEQFKKIGEAYEALRAHFRLHGGRDVVTQLPTMRPFAGAAPRAPGAAGPPFGFRPAPGGSAGAPHARRPRPPAEEPPNLFADAPGGFARERQARPQPPGAHSGAPFMSSTHERANERWWRAHGERVPMSGYSKARGDAGFASMQGAEAAPRQPRHSAYKEDHTETSQREPHFFSKQPHATSARNKYTGAGKRFSPGFTSRNGHNAPFAHHNTSSHSDDGNPDGDSIHSCSDSGMDFSDGKQQSFFSRADVSREAEREEKLRELHREWSRLEKDMSRKMDNLRGGIGRRSTKDEEDYVARKAAADEEFLNRSKERERLNEVHAKGILDERLMLKRVLFTQLYTPDPADVALMPDSDVFVLCELLRDVGKNMSRVLEGRMTKGLCARCSVASKSQCTRAFSCSHPSVCEGCAATCAMCPVCGAGRK